MNNKIVIVSGDPNSINSEIIFKTWKKLNEIDRKNIFIITSYKLLRDQFKKLKFTAPVIKIEDINQNIKTNKIKILNVDINFKNPFKVNKKIASKFVKESLNLAHNLAVNRKVKGIINCAIDKRLLSDKNIGVTEYLSQKCKIKKNTEVMMISNEKISVCPITTHANLKDVSKKINKKNIINKINTINKFYKKIYKVKPRIGVLGLNPHNAELRKKSEEIKEIIPAIKYLIQKGLKISGPLISDTIFMNDYKKYNVIVGMYHDQVLSPFKALFKFNAINITLGLKYLRLSPDHGTAKNLINKKKANSESLDKCINFLKEIKYEIC